MSGIVRKSLAKVKVTPQRRQELRRLAARPEAEIDTSDAPELDAAAWRRAVANPFYKPIKKQVTLRLDADVIAWLQRKGRGYQTRANALLREEMLRELAPKPTRAAHKLA